MSRVIASDQMWTCPETGWSVNTESSRELPARLSQAMIVALKSGQIKHVRTVSATVSRTANRRRKQDDRILNLFDHHSRHSRHTVAEAIKLLLESEDKSVLTATGVPTVAAISKIVGRQVTADERDYIMDKDN